MPTAAPAWRSTELVVLQPHSGPLGAPGGRAGLRALKVRVGQRRGESSDSGGCRGGRWPREDERLGQLTVSEPRVRSEGRRGLPRSRLIPRGRPAPGHLAEGLPFSPSVMGAGAEGCRVASATGRAGEGLGRSRALD